MEPKRYNKDDMPRCPECDIPLSPEIEKRRWNKAEEEEDARKKLRRTDMRECKPHRYKMGQFHRGCVKCGWNPRLKILWFGDGNLYDLYVMPGSLVCKRCPRCHDLFEIDLCGGV